MFIDMYTYNYIYIHIYMFSFSKVIMDFRKIEILSIFIQFVSNKGHVILSDGSHLGNNTKILNGFVTM